MSPLPTRRIALPVLAGHDTAVRPSGRRSQSLPAQRASHQPQELRVAMITLGCDKNTVDSERLLARVLHTGARVVAAEGEADVILVNTCGFIDMAKEESVDAILAAVRSKQAGRARAVVALGCLVQRYKDELSAELPEVDLFLGLTETDRLLPELRARGLLGPEAAPLPTMERPLRALTTATPHTTFLKISEGCDHTCAFCAIPLMRGRFRSTPLDALLREARELEARGVVELNIVSQDTTWYGRDWRRGAVRAGDDFFIGREFARMAGPRRRAATGPGAAAGAGAATGAAAGSAAGAGSRAAADTRRVPPPPP
ncbi:MAG: radical SAM protein, partial [Longimicrobiales bacterium]